MFRLILTTEEENKIKVNFWNEYDKYTRRHRSFKDLVNQIV